MFSLSLSVVYSFISFYFQACVPVCSCVCICFTNLYTCSYIDLLNKTNEIRIHQFYQVKQIMLSDKYAGSSFDILFLLCGMGLAADNSKQKPKKDDGGMMLIIVGSVVTILMLVALIGGLCYIKKTHVQFYSKLPSMSDFMH